jgi:hypothetical protein
MIIYRPHRGRLDEAMKEAVEFNNIQEMKEYIVEEWDGYFSVDDIVIGDDIMNDERNGWKDTRHVCTKWFGEDDNIKLYGCPQCIGWCATDYKKFE